MMSLCGCTGVAHGIAGVEKLLSSVVHYKQGIQGHKIMHSLPLGDWPRVLGCA
jgi:hypothetical protein